METSIIYRPTKAVVHLEAIKDNVRNVKTFLGAKTALIAVVKADGYGHGEVQIAAAALEAGAEMVSVATPDEAVRLRMAGITGDILVMGPSPVSFVTKAAELGVAIAVSNESWLKEALSESKSFTQPLKIHVKIDSGMGRIGLRDAKALQLLVSAMESSKQVLFEGIFTHFACADEEDSNRTKIQFKKFMDFVNSLATKPRFVHASNSAATLLYPEYGLDAVRFGIGLYGIAPSDYVGERLPFPLERSMSIESELAFVKMTETGNSISYGATYETTQNEWIGTIPIGYADGLRRGLRGQDVLIGGERVPIVGTICMDQCMVRLPREMPIGEKVVFIGRQGTEEIKMEEWAKRLGTIPYEIAVSISKRVPRVYPK
ncbi:alanine racemase [Sporosarcina sp. G11-34]|uniref:alanine racemase n=1 Tax=Sporosarcina sp. G11-34 TaxID=2849605 RepID=UPI0022A9C3EB|nr:alanine racemase [Sporosarcina sp. G11-34]MCZ2260418.1 alanine racemase [Sporosarcina sp. G11-34]